MLGPQVPGRPSGLPPAVEMPAVPIRAQNTRGSLLTMYVLRPAWLIRREIALTAAVVALVGGGWMLGGWPVALVVAVYLAAMLGVSAVRGWLVALLWRARIIRRWDRAARFAGLATHNDRVPRVMEATPTGAGERLLVRVPKGGAACDIEDRAPWLASSLEAAEVLVSADDLNARYAHVEVIRRDPLDAFGVLGWPWADAPDQGWVADAWEPIPVGVSETGALVTVSLLSDGLVPVQGGPPEIEGRP
ncbi:hypothetical protein HTZ77_19750 [Nonomuraea sp. SMC257]|uniref:Uncharacterized protein n=1 Tax=Nonomuraea montanisoli TaxID=2741721 RepID=A0A7Y6I929_9ACTN|nr:hypothetical protein [Nonomuraea montanisoli]NUW33651.1 hypothetical protein [Nonomuraea montanisoli]